MTIPSNPVLPTLLVRYCDLEQLGIHYSRTWLRKLIADGKFPKPIALSPRRQVWSLASLEHFIGTKSPPKEVHHGYVSSA